MASESESFFRDELATLYAESQEAVQSAADELRGELRREFARKLNISSEAVERGIKVYHFERASYVRLNPFLASFAQRLSIRGNPNLWILLPDGKRLGFKRIDKKNSWRHLKAKYGSKLRFSHNVLIYRHTDNRNYAIYKLEKVRNTKKVIDLEELANKAIK